MCFKLSLFRFYCCFHFSFFFLSLVLLLYVLLACSLVTSCILAKLLQMHLQTIHSETHHQTKCVQCIMAKITAYFNNNGSWCSFTLAQQRSTAESKVCAAHIVWLLKWHYLCAAHSIRSLCYERVTHTHTHLSTLSVFRLLFDRVNFNNSKNFTEILESVMHIRYFMYSDFIGITIFTVSWRLPQTEECDPKHRQQQWE